MTSDQSGKARRSGSEARQKGRVLSIRVSAAEHAELLAASDRAGESLGAYVRQRVLAAPVTRAHRRPSVEVETLAKALGEVNRSGSNIHQLLKLMRFGGTPAGEEIAAAVAEWRSTVAEIMVAMGRAPR